MTKTYACSLADVFKKARTTSATDSSFPSRVATTTEPADDGVVSLAAVTNDVSTWVKVVPFASGSDGDTFDVRVIGWTRISTLWVPTILLQFTATLSAAVGVAGAAVLDTERFADTVSDPATGMGGAGVNCQPTSPANDTPAHYLFDSRGCPKLEFLFDRTGGSASMNVLYSQI